MLRGLDVSSFQGSVDWLKAAEALNLRFVIVKTAEGMGQKPDSFAISNVKNARAAGLATGGYFFLHPQASVSPQEQAKLHFSIAQDCGLNRAGDLPPCVDLETPLTTSWSNVGFSPSSLRGWTLDYMAELGSLWGMSPVLYSYPDFLMQLGVGGEPAFAAYRLWLASYTERAWPVNGQRPIVLRPWTSWSFWQWSAQVKLPSGVSVDGDVFWGEETDLQAILQRPDVVAETIDAVVDATDSKAAEES